MTYNSKLKNQGAVARENIAGSSPKNVLKPATSLPHYFVAPTKMGHKMTETATTVEGIFTCEAPLGVWGKICLKPATSLPHYFVAPTKMGHKMTETATTVEGIFTCEAPLGVWGKIWVTLAMKGWEK